LFLGTEIFVGRLEGVLTNIVNAFKVTNTVLDSCNLILNILANGTAFCSGMS